MKILICSENFYPSIGGVQEVVLQIATRLKNLNHDVTIATSIRDDRKEKFYNKIKIKEFNIVGNYVFGIKGNKSDYLNFVINSKFDYIFIYAAQQWTFDSLIDIFNQIPAKIIFVPCGFSALYISLFKNYFDKVKKEVSRFHHVVFHTRNYQDFYFLEKHLLKSRYSIIPNGADLFEFGELNSKIYYKKKFNLNDEIVILSNSSLSYDKGQLTLLKILNKLRANKKIILYINANDNFKILNYKTLAISFAKFLYRILFFKEFKLSPNIIYFLIKLKMFTTRFSKKVSVKYVNLHRSDLINLYKASDLFIFTSKVEYCPLVIMESMAAGTAFVSSNVGNVKSLIDENQCGLICETSSHKGINKINYLDLIQKTNYLISNDDVRNQLASNGRKAFLKNYNWDKIFLKYSSLFK